MRQELTSPNPSQKFPDRLGGNHSSVLFTAEERREIIASIADETYIAMGYPLRQSEREKVVRVWCEAFDSVPDVSLEDVRKEGLKREARTPQEYVKIHEEWLGRAVNARKTRELLDRVANEKATAVPAGELSTGKRYAMDLWKQNGILK